MNIRDNPRVYIPPPLIYIAIFAVSFFLQKKVAINDSMFKKQFILGAGIIFFILALFFIARSLLQFIRSENTVVTIKGASSLQTNGIFEITRNPMYLGLVMVYLGLTCLIGNWWNLIFLPFLLLIIQEYVIKREEKYLERKFGQEYTAYKQVVRRWL